MSDKPIAIHELAGSDALEIKVNAILLEQCTECDDHSYPRGECPKCADMLKEIMALLRREFAASLAYLERQVEAWQDEAKRNAALPHKTGRYYPDEWSGQVKAYNGVLALLRGPR